MPILLILKSSGELENWNIKVCANVEAVPAVEQQKDPWTLRLGTWSCLGSGASYATWGKPHPPPDLSFPVCEVKLCTRLSSSLSRGLPCASGTPDSGLGGVQQDVGSRPRRAHVLKGPLGGWRGPSRSFHDSSGDVSQCPALPCADSALVTTPCE